MIDFPESFAQSRLRRPTPPPAGALAQRAQPVLENCPRACACARGNSHSILLFSIIDAGGVRPGSPGGVRKGIHFKAFSRPEVIAIGLLHAWASLSDFANQRNAAAAVLIRARNHCPSLVLEYCPGLTRIDIQKRGAPPTRFGKSLDLPLSFPRSDLFAWPAALYRIL